MFTDARARKFDLLLFWSLSRFSREGVSATLGHLERLRLFRPPGLPSLPELAGQFRP
jgi:hypothetical protein